MTVAELQRYLYGLADAVASAPQSEAVVRELRDASAALGVFAPLSLPELTDFLTAAWAYKMTGVLPMPPAKPAPPTVVGLAARGSADFLAVAIALCDPTTHAGITRDQIKREVQSFRHLDTQPLAEVATGLGMVGVPRHRSGILNAIADHIERRRAIGRREQSVSQSPVANPPAPPAEEG